MSKSTLTKTEGANTRSSPLPGSGRVVVDASEYAALLQDKVRLDYMDECNRRLNAHCGSSYGWKMILSHNVTRLMLESPYGCEFAAVDLHDSEGGYRKRKTCREAIDEYLQNVERTNREQDQQSQGE